MKSLVAALEKKLAAAEMERDMYKNRYAALKQDSEARIAALEAEMKMEQMPQVVEPPLPAQPSDRAMVLQDIRPVPLTSNPTRLICSQASASDV